MSKLQKQAKELLQSAHKIYHYRRDLIPEGRLDELEKAVGEVDTLMRQKPCNDVDLKAAMGRLDGLLGKLGGKMYPKTFWNDNIEVLLVAAILVIGVRTFFFQPFIIPTNSMYPTYSGMNSVVYEAEAESPTAAKKILSKLVLGASHYRADAPKEGIVHVPVFSQAPGSSDQRLRGMGVARFDVVGGRKWLVLPAQKREYLLYVDNQPVKLRVPFEFNLDDVIRDTFFPEASSLMQVVVERHEAGQTNVLTENPVLETTRNVQTGDALIEFDITLGDALFVDRMSYHFIRPEAGDPFVFRTRDIPGIEGGVDKYYIKRIGGVGGETLEIVDGTLFADGEPRDEVEAFERNANREGEYGGYINTNLLAEGRQLSIPEDSFVALGDNSGNSLDSRYWGFVPETSVIGKAIFIYYPFTKRWGLAE